MDVCNHAMFKVTGKPLTHDLLRYNIYTIFKCSYVFFNIYFKYYKNNNKEDCTKTEGLKDTEIVYTRIYRRKAFNLTTYHVIDKRRSIYM